MRFPAEILLQIVELLDGRMHLAIQALPSFELQSPGGNETCNFCRISRGFHMCYAVEACVTWRGKGCAGLHPGR